MKTVFVLGAAANKDLDKNGAMPIGSELANRIQAQITHELQNRRISATGIIADTFASSGGFGDEHLKAMARIEQGITFRDSIDEFLDEWSNLPKLMEVGKVAIASQVLTAESKTRLAKALIEPRDATRAMMEVRESWLGQLLRYANPGVRRRDVEECLAEIGFITFNYDRCLEASLYLFCRSGQNLDENTTLQVLNQTPIYHAYGSLGGCLGNAGPKIPLGANDHWYIFRASQGIRTFTEEVDSIHQMGMRKLIEGADAIVFLGFGFHRQNLDLLLPESMADKKIYATVYGMRQAQIKAAQAYFEWKGGHLNTYDVECGALIDDLRETLFSQT